MSSGMKTAGFCTTCVGWRRWLPAIWLLLVCVSPTFADDYLYGVLWSFSYQEHPQYILRFAEVHNDTLDHNTAMVIGWYTTRTSQGKRDSKLLDFQDAHLDESKKSTYDRITHVVRKYFGAIPSEIDPALINENPTLYQYCRFIADCIHEAQSETGKIGNREVYIRWLDFENSEINRDALLWFAGQFTGIKPDPKIKVTPNLIVGQRLNLDKYTALQANPNDEYLLSELDGAFNQSYTNWQKRVSTKATQQEGEHVPDQLESANASGTNYEENVNNPAEAKEGDFMQTIIFFLLFVLLISQLLFYWMIYIRKEGGLRELKEDIRDMTEDLVILQKENDSLRDRSQPTYTANALIDEKRLHPSNRRIKQDDELRRSTGIEDLREIIENKLKAFNERIDRIRTDQKSKDDISAELQPLHSEILQLTEKLENLNAATKTLSCSISEHLDKALEDQRSILENRIDQILGKVKGLQELVPDLQAGKLEELNATMKASAEKLADDELGKADWYRKVWRQLKTGWEATGTLDEWCKHCEKHHRDRSARLKDRVLVQPLRLKFDEGRSAERALQQAVSSLVLMLAEPAAAFEEEMDRELIEFLGRLYNQLDEHPGKAREQIRGVESTLNEVGVSWLLPNDGADVDEERHLILDYRVGSGRTSTVAELIKPGYEIRRRDTLIDRIQARIAVYR